MITVQGLTKRYARTLAVDHISFEVKKGQIVGFLGPNGAGKTTTMRILTCFLPPSEGTRHRGRFRRARTAHGSEKAHRLSAGNPAGLSGNGGRRIPHICRKAERHVGRRAWPIASTEVCERCAVADVRTKLIGKLSKGYRQRVGLAQAIIHNPDVLILDEPTAGLDPKQINETRDLIKSLAGDHTIILSTHILPEVEQTCEQVLIINKGKLVATDSVHNLQNRARGAESVMLEVEGRNGALDSQTIQHRLETVNGVSRVLLKESRDNRSDIRSGELEGPLHSRRSGARHRRIRLESERAARLPPSAWKKSSCN